MVTPRRDCAPDVEERDIPSGRQQWSMVEVTPNSVIVSWEVNSPAGSGIVVHNSFGTAILDTWSIGLEYEYGWKKIMGDEAPPKLREGRRAFKALLDRWKEKGYTPEMATELEHLNATYGTYGAMTVEEVLPYDLGKVLDMCYPDDWETDGPPGITSRADFDLDNPRHLELLQRRLEELAEC